MPPLRTTSGQGCSMTALSQKADATEEDWDMQGQARFLAFLSVDAYASPAQTINNRSVSLVTPEEALPRSNRHPALAMEIEETQLWCVHCNQAVQCNKRGGRVGYSGGSYRHGRQCKYKLVKAMETRYGCSKHKAAKLGLVWLEQRKSTWAKHLNMTSTEREALMDCPGYYTLPPDTFSPLEPLDGVKGHGGPPCGMHVDSPDQDEDQASSSFSSQGPFKRRGHKRTSILTHPFVDRHGGMLPDDYTQARKDQNFGGPRTRRRGPRARPGFEHSYPSKARRSTSSVLRFDQANEEDLCTQLGSMALDQSQMIPASPGLDFPSMIC